MEPDQSVEAIRARIWDACRQAGLDRFAEIARTTGEDQANVRRYLTDRDPRTPSLPFCRAVCQRLMVSADWLFFGTGPMRRGAVDWSAISYDELQAEAARQRLELERELAALQERIEAGPAEGGLDVFRKLGLARGKQIEAPAPRPASPGGGPRPADPAGRPRTLRIVGGEELEADRDWRDRFVPIVDNVAAGLGAEPGLADAIPPGWADEFLEYSRPPENAFAVRVQGDSMAPGFHDGDLVVVDPAEEAKSGEPAVVVYTDPETDAHLARLKRIRKRGRGVQLISDNPGHPETQLPASAVRYAFAVFDHVRREERGGGA